MGKIRTRIIGLEDVEKEQKQEQKKRSDEKKQEKHKIRAQGLKGGERMVSVEVDEKSAEKMKKAEEMINKKEVAGKKEKKKITKARSRGENYQKAKKSFDRSKTFKLKDAIDILKKIKFTKFDESVELHFNVDEVGLRGELEFPHSTGKSTKVKIVDEKLLTELEKGKIDFDILVTHPSFMPKLAKFAKILGPRGLMPNPKAGTISPKPEEIAKKYEKGLIKWKTEAKFPLIHQMIGKLSAENKALVDNAEKFIKSVGASHIRSGFIKSTMSPSVKIDTSNL